jgi:hypothetical protein
MLHGDPGKAESVSQYSGSCIGMGADEVLNRQKSEAL